MDARPDPSNPGPNLDAGFEGMGNLLANEGVALAKDMAALRVAENHPLAARVQQHGRAWEEGVCVCRGKGEVR